MSEELRAAAQRILDDDCGGHEGLEGDATGIAMAYLAEHPADDGEAITDDWLDTVIVKGLLDWNYREDTHWRCLEVFIHDWWHDYPLPSGATRGTVRRLASALGIELKEPP